MGVDGPPSEDKELALAFKQGKKGAYDAIYSRYSTRVLSVCRRMLSSPEEAQDAAQETFLRVYQGLGRFNGRYQMGPWIARIATNVCLDHIRARQRRPSDPMPLEALDLGATTERAEPVDPESLYIRGAESRRIRRHLASLPPMHRAAIVLRDFEGLSYADVAATLEVSEPQVKALIHRARQSFRRSWTPAGLAAMIPVKLFNRIKELCGLAKDPLSSAGSSMAQFGPACSAALQQCGQVVSDRVVPVAAAIVLGTAGSAAAAATLGNHDPAPSTTSVAAASVAAIRLEAHPRNHRAGRGAAKSASRRVAAPPATAPVSQPTPAPAPKVGGSAPTPQPSESPAPPAPASSPPPSPSPSSSEPAQFLPAVGFATGQAMKGYSPSQNYIAIDCGAGSFDQKMEVPFSDGPQTYRADVMLQFGSQLNLEVVLWKDYKRIDYTSQNATLQLETSGDHLLANLNGSYQTQDNKTADAEGVPRSGQFSARLNLDCSSGSVITEELVLSH